MAGPEWAQSLLSEGGLFTGVAQILEERKGTFTKAVVLPGGREIWMQIDFPDSIAPNEKLTVYGFLVHQAPDGGTHITSQPSSTWFAHRPTLIAAFFQHIKEICAGMGGLGIGASQAGIQSIAHMDHNLLPDPPLERRSERHPRRRLQLHGAGLLGAGFPCQPYSSQGGRKGPRTPAVSSTSPP